MEILGIDIGGSGIKGAVVNIQTGELLTERLRLETPQPATTQAVTETIASLVEQLKWEGSIGCGFPSVVKNGWTITAANVDETWINADAEKIFSEALNRPVKVINDADAAGLAEMKFGVGKDRSGLVLMLTIGTGIGSALFYDGKLIPNSEFGHLYYKDVVAEKYCSDLARKKLEMDWDEWTRRFNHFLKHLERTINPDLIIIGGGISKKQEKFANDLISSTEVAIARLENNAGIIGAALAIENPIVHNGLLDKVKSYFKKS